LIETKKLVIFAIMLVNVIFGAVILATINYLRIPTQRPTLTTTPTIQPTGNLTVTPKTTLETTPTAPTVTVIPKPSTLGVISPTINATYHTNAVDLTYTIDSKVLWSYYDLDSNGYVSLENLFRLNVLVPFKGNITLNLSEGPHRLMIAVQTEESRFSSHPIAHQTIDFFVGTTGSDISSGIG
jgi:hypothetical protein